MVQLNRMSASDFNASMSGRKSQRNGDGFENLFCSFASRSGILCIRFPNGCRTLRGAGGRPRFIPVKTPFDWILSKPGKSVFLDTKTTGAVNFSYSQITDHQLVTLGALERHGHQAGYVVHFQKTHQVVFFKAGDLAQLGPRDSLEAGQGVDLGTIFDMRPERLFE